MEHYIKKCKMCEVVLEQCRCPDLHKNITYGLCGECRISLSAQELGKLGGLKKSKKKVLSSKKNGRKGGRPKKVVYSSIKEQQ
jgi:hypothetical protein